MERRKRILNESAVSAENNGKPMEIVYLLKVVLKISFKYKIKNRKIMFATSEFWEMYSDAIIAVLNSYLMIVQEEVW